MITQGDVRMEEDTASDDGGIRFECDSLGRSDVPRESYWGIHTKRALENFSAAGKPISIHPSLVTAFASVKEAAVRANNQLRQISDEKANAIIQACHRISQGDLHDEFVVDVLQGGAGTSSNMNANEVIANAALQFLGYEFGRYDIISPLDDVNKSQSTNDTYPTVIRLAILRELPSLVERVEQLADAFSERADALFGIKKIGRTQLQDALPMEISSEFDAFASSLRAEIDELRALIPALSRCNIGGTAIGSGINAPKGFQEAAISHLSRISGVELRKAEDLYEASWNQRALTKTMNALHGTAITLSKISDDLRLLGSGPQAGLAEIHLPATQAGSSIMPGKVNPVILEMVNQTCFKVMGSSYTVSRAASAGQLQLNAFEPLIAHMILESMAELSRAAESMRVKCVSGITAQVGVLNLSVSESIRGLTGLVPIFGYDLVAQAAKTAMSQGISPVDALATTSGLSREDAQRIFVDHCGA